jgi:hypothetical protein
LFFLEYPQFDVSKQFTPFYRSAFGFKARVPPGRRPVVHAVNDREEEKVEE